MGAHEGGERPVAWAPGWGGPGPMGRARASGAGALPPDQPDAGEGDFREGLNPASRAVVTAWLEPSTAALGPDVRVQFERHGYFVPDRVDHRGEAPVFNRITGLKDSRGK